MKTDKKEVKKLKNKGFTLIELLIVITLLGILAVAVLSAINPIEQINRSRDTASRSDTEQLSSAISRYYATQGYYPWQTGATDTDDINVGWASVTDAEPADDDTEAMLDKLSSAGTGEVKASFTNRITQDDYNTLYIYNRGQQGDSVYLCFVPLSQQFETEAEERCTSGTPVDYPSEACDNDIDGDGTNDFAVCLP